MALRRIMRSVIAAGVTLGGIFGLIVDAPDVFDLLSTLWGHVSAWGQAMLSDDLGYWLLIVGGVLSLIWSNLGSRIRSRWLNDRRSATHNAYPTNADVATNNGELAIDLPSTEEQLHKAEIECRAQLDSIDGTFRQHRDQLCAIVNDIRELQRTIYESHHAAQNNQHHLALSNHVLEKAIRTLLWSRYHEAVIDGGLDEKVT